MLEAKVRAVEEVFDDLDHEIARLQDSTGMHCKFGCGQCCLKPDIEASALEFLPFALHLHKTGQADAWYERVKSTGSSICLILNPTQPGSGHCSEYPHRGLICRLFGYSARTNKYGKHELITCQIIKTEQSLSYQQAQRLSEEGGNVPVMTDYYMRLHGIDAELAREFYPINTAIRKALEIVLQYYAYR
jgi:uncharacterized protein